MYIMALSFAFAPCSKNCIFFDSIFSLVMLLFLRVLSSSEILEWQGVEYCLPRHSQNGLLLVLLYSLRACHGVVSYRLLIPQNSLTYSGMK